MTAPAPVSFSQIVAERPDLVALKSEYDRLGGRFDTSSSPAERALIVREWDKLRRKTETWSSLSTLHFEQDSRNPEYVQERKLHDVLTPQLTALDIEMKRRLLHSSHRSELEREFGSHIFATWGIELAAFDPKIVDDLVEEARLCSEYTAIIAGADVEFAGAHMNLAALDAFTKVAHRDTRHSAQKVRWDFYAAHEAEFDRIFEELVRNRTAMARKLGFENYVSLGYKRMKRLDYNEHDVARYRDDVREHIVPLAEMVVRERAARLGLSEATFWDESLHDNLGNPKPAGDGDAILAAGAAAFHALHPELGSFFDLMIEKQLLDLDNRAGKSGGGFCTNFPSYGLPFIFANFNGTEHDVVVLLHEMGHAYQNYASRHVALYDNLWPTYETAEVHSMSMEFLMFDQMDRFFGADAERFRDHHLAEALMFIPYGCAIDHFQHLVYAQPDASPEQRHDMWKRLEKDYLPWRRYGDLAFPSKGALWQEKRHVYLLPFYYIDYTLAQCCALQFWARSRTDLPGALHDYMALCARGGTAPFAALIRSANLESPFHAGALSEVAAQARQALGLTLRV